MSGGRMKSFFLILDDLVIPLPECDPNSELARQQKMIAEIPNHLGIPKEYLERITRVSTLHNVNKGISSVSISINFSYLEKYAMADVRQMYSRLRRLEGVRETDNWYAEITHTEFDSDGITMCVRAKLK